MKWVELRGLEPLILTLPAADGEHDSVTGS
jgi:hypothetical protein